MSTGNYIVAWTNENTGKKRSAHTEPAKYYVDHYQVFKDGTAKENEKAADDLWHELISCGAYSASICEITQSTDHE